MTPPPTEITQLLQKGIAAARSGRSAEARQMLQQVIEAEPDNEMAWLWLSGLVPTSAQKRACLEKVLKANPHNVYAQVGLARLQDAADEIEARLASVTSGNSARAKTPAFPKPPQPTGNRQKAQRSKTEAEALDQEPPNASMSAPPKPETAPSSISPQLTCPACDGPISPTAKMCPHCFMPFRSLEELLGRDDQPSTENKRRRGGILGYLGSLTS